MLSHNLSSHPRITIFPHSPSARHYHSDLSLWLSVDPMSDKYPSTSPYAYCGNNPVVLKDPNGQTFVVADNEESHKDILSIVEKRHQDRVIFEKDGTVSVNRDGLSDAAFQDDIGLSLINDMSISDKKYYYETSDIALCCNSDGGRITLPTYAKKYGGIVNASRYGLDSERGHTQLPMEGFDGQVVVTKSGQFVLRGDARKNIIFHELEENYLRTDRNMNYWGPKGVGAHETAADIEFQGWGSLGGWATYKEPSLRKEDFEIIYPRKNNYLKNGTY